MVEADVAGVAAVDGIVNEDLDGLEVEGGGIGEGRCGLGRVHGGR